MSTPSESKIVRDPAFGARLTETLDRDPNVPPPNYGRLGWIKDQFAIKFKEPVSAETVRKWIAGEVKPKPERIEMLAELLSIDRGWLAFGLDPAMTEREKRTMSTEGDGAVLLVAGLIKMAGGQVAFPSEDDKRAKASGIDVHAFIKGGKYDIHVAVAQPEPDGSMKFFVPANFEGVMQIGAIMLGDFAVRLIEITEDIISTDGRRRGGSIEVVMTSEQLEEFEIKSLRQRL